MYEYDEPETDPRVDAYCEKHGLNRFIIDWHLEAQHGWERHDKGYEEAIEDAANCEISRGCEYDLPKHLTKDKLAT